MYVIVLKGDVKIEKCIYISKSSTNLLYKKREHIIPAGLGGINMLPKGYVSDQANELFSQIEMKIMRNSLLSVNRENNGPGRRGTLNVKKLRNPTMRVLKNGDIPSDSYQIGFIFTGKSYLIPQVRLDFNDAKSTIRPHYFSHFFKENQEVLDILEFQKQFLSFLVNRKRTFILLEMPYQTNKHFISVGKFKDKWFAATSHKYINMDILAFELIPSLKETIKRNSEKIKITKVDESTKYNYKYELDLEEVDMNFLYLKTAFNLLAAVKGLDFVLNRAFDDIRESILNCRGFEKYIVSEREELFPYIKRLKIKPPPKSHIAIILSVENNLYAFVSFYTEPPCIMRLTNNYNGEKICDGLICDWQNRNEYELSKYT